MRLVHDRFLAHPRDGPLPALLLALTVVSGVVDAVSILRMGRVFVANMTGNVVFIGFGVAGAAGFSVIASLTALAGFVIGAGVGGWIPRQWSRDRARTMRNAVVVKLALAAPVVVVANVDGISPGRPVTYALSALLAASMGMQNATVRRLGVPDFPTTVLTMALTGLVADVRARGWRDPTTGYRLASIAALFLGGVVGAALVVHVDAGAALVLGGGVLAAVGILAHLMRDAAWAAFPAP